MKEYECAECLFVSDKDEFYQGSEDLICPLCESNNINEV